MFTIYQYDIPLSNYLTVIIVLKSLEYNYFEGYGMKSAVLILLTCTLSSLLIGINVQVRNMEAKQASDAQFAYNSNLAKSMAILNSLPQSNCKDRNWRLKEFLYKDTSTLGGTLGTRVKEILYYNAVHPAQIDSINCFTSDTAITPSYRNKYYYDTSAEHVIRIEGSSYDNNALSQKRTIFDYDSQNRKIGEHYIKWNDGINQLSENERYYYVYGDDRLLESYRVTYAGADSTFLRTIYTHDTQGRVISYIKAMSSDSLSWNDMSIVNQSYAPFDTSTGNTLIQYLSQVHRFEFLLDFAFENGYGNLDEVIGQAYEQYEPHYISKLVYSYDNLNRVNTMTDLRHYSDDTWRARGLYTYTYDSNNNLCQYSEQLWNPTNSEWNSIQDQFVYIWEQNTPNDDETCPEIAFELSVYPNPFRNVVTFDINSKNPAPYEASIYNLKGQLIKSFNKQKNSTFTWDGNDKDNRPVSNGVYLVKVNQNGRISSKKIIHIK